MKIKWFSEQERDEGTRRVFLNFPHSSSRLWEQCMMLNCWKNLSNIRIPQAAVRDIIFFLYIEIEKEREQSHQIRWNETENFETLQNLFSLFGLSLLCLQLWWQGRDSFSLTFRVTLGKFQADSLRHIRIEAYALLQCVCFSCISFHIFLKFILLYMEWKDWIFALNISSYFCIFCCFTIEYCRE